MFQPPARCVSLNVATREDHGNRRSSTAEEVGLQYSGIPPRCEVTNPKNKNVFVCLTKKIRGTASADVSESLEVAIQCISDSFGVSLTNDEHKTQYSIHPLTLPAAFGLGLARKEQIEAALAVCTFLFEV